MIKDVKNNLLKLRAGLKGGDHDSEIFKAISGEVEKLMKEPVYAPPFPPFLLSLENVRGPVIAIFSDADGAEGLEPNNAAEYCSQFIDMKIGGFILDPFTESFFIAKPAAADAIRSASGAKSDAEDLYDKGEACIADKNYEEGIKYLRQAAEKGHLLAQVNLGSIYANGTGVPQDNAESFKWYKLAAEQGDAEAQFNVGVYYQHGRGTGQNEAEAVKWYTKAAEQDYPKAQYNLGVCFVNGIGTARSYEDALIWFKKAAEHDLGDAHAIVQKLQNLIARG